MVETMRNDKTTGIQGVGTEGSYHLDKEDTQMSITHLKDTLEYNLKHAEDHLTKAKEACERLDKAGEHVDIPKSLLDITSYFEEKQGYHSAEDHADMKLKNHIKRSY